MAGDGQNKAVKIQLYFHEKKGTICIVRPRETPFISDALAHKGLKKHWIQTSNGSHKRASLLSKKGLSSDQVEESSRRATLATNEGFSGSFPSHLHSTTSTGCHFPPLLITALAPMAVCQHPRISRAFLAPLSSFPSFNESHLINLQILLHGPREHGLSATISA